MNREQKEQDCRERIARYYEEHRRFEDLLSQFMSLSSSMELGKPIQSPRRAFDIAPVKEAQQRLDKLRREMNEACNRLYEAYH